jgi:hypothetical protein
LVQEGEKAATGVMSRSVDGLTPGGESLQSSTTSVSTVIPVGQARMKIESEPS